MVSSQPQFTKVNSYLHGPLIVAGVQEFNCDIKFSALIMAVCELHIATRSHDACRILEGRYCPAMKRPSLFSDGLCYRPTFRSEPMKAKLFVTACVWHALRGMRTQS